jgi:hypothetical protein
MSEREDQGNTKSEKHITWLRGKLLQSPTVCEKEEGERYANATLAVPVPQKGVYPDNTLYVDLIFRGDIADEAIEELSTNQRIKAVGYQNIAKSQDESGQEVTRFELDVDNYRFLNDEFKEEEGDED